jgi:hypothetical protein
MQVRCMLQPVQGRGQQTSAQAATIRLQDTTTLRQQQLERGCSSVHPTSTPALGAVQNNKTQLP